jgi:hypothetical protein
MNIIKEPNMTTSCPKCKCEFTFSKEDIKKCGGSGRRPPRQYIGVDCPICNTTIEIWNN